MNPKRCMKCLLHGSADSHPSHNCPWRECACRQCNIIDCRREIANKIVKLSRKQKLELGISDSDARYTCARCRNHGIVVLKKHHTPCPFSLCACEPCALLTERKRIESELNALARGHQAIGSLSSISDSESEESLGCTGQYSEAHIILDLITALATDSFNPETFDYESLAYFFSQPTLLVPEEWASQMGEITELVHAALRKFPRFDGIDFGIGNANR